MSAGFKFAKYAGMAALCLGMLPAYADSAHGQRKTKKQELAPLPSGPTGQKLQPLPLDSISPVLPQVNYENGRLTIIAPNSTLGDILRAVRKQTGAEIEIPTATDRVVTHLGPGPARDVMAELLNGSRFNYVLLGSPDDPSALTRVVLVAKTDTGNGQVAQAPQLTQQLVAQPNMAPPPQDVSQDANDADQPEENADDQNADQQQQPEPEQPANGDQAVKTPQQMLQEMQQRQLQMQQQGQPVPGQPYPGRPPFPQPPPQQQQQ